MKFTKMHGLGNDYLFLDGFTDEALARREDYPALALAMSDRRTGVGADGIIVLSKPGEGDDFEFDMRIFNSDGSEAEMCGNGLRCAVKMLVERAHVRLDEKNRLKMRTGAGVLEAEARFGEDGLVDTVTIAMGKPVFALAKIPVDAAKVAIEREVGPATEFAVGEETGVAVNVGNPHFVCFRETPVEKFALERFGPILEKHEAFPKRINVHIVNVLGPGRLRMRSWERGAGMTTACGTGACATIAAAAATGRCGRSAIVELPGGELFLEWDEETGVIHKTGPAAFVFEGEWPEPGAKPAKPGARLETERLILRPQTWNDLAEIQRGMNDPEISRHTMTIPYPYLPGEGAKFLRRVERRMADGTAAAFALELKSTGEMIGNMGLQIEPEHQRAELGYVTWKEHRGKGYTSEAARRLIDHAFEDLGLEKVFAKWFAANPASGRVLEKAGMVEEGRQVSQQKKKDGRLDVCLMGLTREQWSKRKGSAGS